MASISFILTMLSVLLVAVVLPIRSVDCFHIMGGNSRQKVFSKTIVSGYSVQPIRLKSRQLATIGTNDETATTDKPVAMDHHDNGTTSRKSTTTILSNRRNALQHLLATTAFFVTTTNVEQAVAIPPSEQKFYSSNAKNMARLSAGDKSGGSVYDNDPPSPAAAKRRAMLGCKINSSRSLAARDAGITDEKKGGSFSEKDCNLRVMDGDSEFMLKALRKLDCPTCPYGIDGA